MKTLYSITNRIPGNAHLTNGLFCRTEGDTLQNCLRALAYFMGYYADCAPYHVTAAQAHDAGFRIARVS